jgi:phosphatidylglycerophosphate synthase
LSVAPIWILSLIVAPHIVIAVVTVYARRRGKKLHPSRFGKLGMAFNWISLLGLILLHTTLMHENIYASILVYGITCMGIGLTTAALAAYVKQVTQAK